jgi:quinol monooxygenase YgiN
VPITSILAVHVKPEAVDQALEALPKILADTRAFDGCLGVTLAQHGDDPTQFFAVEQWESLEHDQAYRAWRAGEGAATELGPLLAEPPQLSVGVNVLDL